MPLNRINVMAVSLQKELVLLKSMLAPISLTQKINLGQIRENMEHSYLSL